MNVCRRSVDVFKRLTDLGSHRHQINHTTLSACLSPRSPLARGETSISCGRDHRCACSGRNLEAPKICHKRVPGLGERISLAGSLPLGPALASRRNRSSPFSPLDRNAPPSGDFSHPSSVALCSVFVYHSLRFPQALSASFRISGVGAM